MYKIYVENIRCYSYHGCLEEETVIGGNYVVDVVVAGRLTLNKIYPSPPYA